MLDPLQVRQYADADFAASDDDVLSSLRGLVPHSPRRIVDLGCGPGNISFRLARAWPGAQVLGLDGSPAMLAIARERLRDSPELQGRLAFLDARLPLGPGAPSGFDLLVSNSLLHHLHDPLVLWRGLGPLAAADAFVFVRDLRRPDGPAALDALVERHAATAPELLRRDYAHSLRAAFRVEEVRAQLQAAGLEGLQVEEHLDRYLQIQGSLRSAEPHR